MEWNTSDTIAVLALAISVLTFFRESLLYKGIIIVKLTIENPVDEDGFQHDEHLILFVTNKGRQPRVISQPLLQAKDGRKTFSISFDSKVEFPKLLERGQTFTAYMTSERAYNWLERKNGEKERRLKNMRGLVSDTFEKRYYSNSLSIEAFLKT